MTTTTNIAAKRGGFMPRDRACTMGRLGLSGQLSGGVRTLFYLALIAALFAIARANNGGVGWAIFVGGFVGLVSHWMKACKCLRGDEKEVRGLLERMGYRQLDGNARHYRVNPPRLSYFNHQDVLVGPSNGSMVMTGPQHVLTIVSRRVIGT